MIERWYWIAILSILFFALGSFFGKIASVKDIPYRVYLFEGMGTLTVLTTFLLVKKAEIFTNFSFNFFALLMGVLWGIGTILFIVALKNAKLSVIGPLVALYPAFTVILALVFLGERLAPRELIGVILAIISVALLAK